MARQCYPCDHTAGGIEKRGDKWRARFYVDGATAVGFSRPSRGQAIIDLQQMRAGTNKAWTESDRNSVAVRVESDCNGRTVETGSKKGRRQTTQRKQTLRDDKEKAEVDAERLREGTTHEQVGRHL